MKPHDLRWLADELGLPVFEETAAGVRANPAGEAALAAESDGRSAPASAVAAGVIAAAAAVMGVSPEAAELREAEAHARAGTPHATVLVGAARGRSWRILAAPITDGGAAPARIALALSPVWADASARERMVDLAAAVSHEVANAVGAIRGWADLALAHADPAPSSSDRDASPVPMRDALSLIAGAARSAEHAARGMLTLARASAQEDEPAPRLDLSDFASELLHLLTLTAREARVTLESSIAPQLFVQATRAQAFTILFNLVKNAIEACHAGGKVSVRAYVADGVADRPVVLSVTDDGEGLDPIAKKRLFEPYYTTKPTGTGLGLGLVLEAVRGSGATLEVSSELGRGTSFQVSLPRVVGPSEGSRVDLKPVAAADAPLDARILVVDDDRALREMLATALSLRGAEVTSVASGAEALALFDARSEPFDVALIDVLLEGTRGDELLAHLRQRGLVDAAMLVTGTVQRPRPVAGGEPDDWVRKPFEIPQLVERIHRVLASARQRHHARRGASA